MKRLGVVLPSQATSLRRLAVACGAVWLGFAADEVSAAIPASERAALIALYNSTNGAGWADRTNWRNATDTDFAVPGTECTWLGVRCDPSESHVTLLGLPGGHLSGPIPPEIGNLSVLQWLSLNSNQLAGSIPPEIGNLSQLTDLILNDNQLSGSIPPEIGNLSNLWHLHLHNNQLSGSIPAEIGNLSHLAGLHLRSNQLSGPIPPATSSLTMLSNLDLSWNQLSGSIPPKIDNLTVLRLLSLKNNRLSGPIPPEIGNLKTLSYLFLSGNQLTGSIPPEIGNLSNLNFWYLHLDNNQLSGSIPCEIGNLSNLTDLYLNDNQLSGSIPPEIGNLSHLTDLYLNNNQLTGSIPREIGKVRSVRYLSLDDNRLGGPIPDQIGQLTGLRRLTLLGNRFSGSIPPGIGNLTNLIKLDLAGNHLRGPVPPTLANLTGLSDDFSDLRWNALYSSDAALRTFLDSKQIGGDWEGTQTVTPTGLAAGGAMLDSVRLSWSPILYTGDTGGYRLWYGTLAGGPYSLFGTTPDKAASASAVSSLSPGTTYYFALDTVTEPHANNQNTVVSERTAEVSATTPAGGPGWYRLAVVREGPGTVSSLPSGIACGGACSATFAPGTAVTLTALSDAGSSFLGWGGACAGTVLTCDLTLDAVQAVTASFSPPAVSFYTVTPCRVYDSRDAGLGGSSPLAAGTATAVAIGGYCRVPPTAETVSLNVTVVSPSTGGHLRLYASGMPRPMTSSMNYAEGQTRANNAVVPLSADGAIAVYVGQPSGTTHVVIDVNGYFQ